MALRQVAADSGAALLKAVDGILDTLTDGEHSRMMRKLEEEQGQKEEENEADKMKVIEEHSSTLKCFRAKKSSNQCCVNSWMTFPALKISVSICHI